MCIITPSVPLLGDSHLVHLRPPHLRQVGLSQKKAALGQPWSRAGLSASILQGRADLSLPDSRGLGTSEQQGGGLRDPRVSVGGWHVTGTMLTLSRIVCSQTETFIQGHLVPAAGLGQWGGRLGTGSAGAPASGCPVDGPPRDGDLQVSRTEVSASSPSQAQLLSPAPRLPPVGRLCGSWGPHWGWTFYNIPEALASHCVPGMLCMITDSRSGSYNLNPTCIRSGH